MTPFDSAFNWGFVIGVVNFASIWTVGAVAIWLILRQTRYARETSEAAAMAAVEIVNTKGDLKAAVQVLQTGQTDAVGQIKSDAADAAHATALSTPGETVLPTNLQRTIVIGTKVPSPPDQPGGPR